MEVYVSQDALAAADLYESGFVPALFARWPPRVLEAADVRPGDRVLDVACGTGILAREAMKRVGPGGKVTGIDLSPAMLAVAERIASLVEWRQGTAMDLPFDDGAFDAVVSQFGLMFFDDKPAAIAEMVRVLAPGGRLAVAVWDVLDHSPGFADLMELLGRLFGDSVAGALRAPFNLGDRDDLLDIFAEADLPDAEIATRKGRARFDTMDAFIDINVRGWPPLREQLSEGDLKLLRGEARHALKHLVRPDGSVEFPTSAHIVSAIPV